MRCLVLARELRKRSATVSFVSRALEGNVLHKVRAEGFAVRELPVERVGESEDAAATLAACGSGVAVVIVDSYELGAEWEARIASAGIAVVALDDAPRRPHASAVLLDQNFGRISAEYESLVPKGTKVLAGLDFALVRQDVRALRPAGGRVRQPDGPHIVVNFGGSDATNASVACLRELVSSGIAARGRVTVIMGPGAGVPADMDEIAIQAGGRIAVLRDPVDYATRLSRADVIVGAGGSSVWERCCLGIPSVTLIVAENQREMGERLAAAGVTVLGEIADVARHVSALLGDHSAWERMSRTAASLVDGGGPTRVADIILEGAWARN